MDEKTYKVLNSSNLRNYVKITVSHRKLIKAGFVMNNKATYNNSEEVRFTSRKKCNIKSSAVGPGKYSNPTDNWIKRSYNSKFK